MDDFEERFLFREVKFDWGTEKVPNPKRINELLNLFPKETINHGVVKEFYENYMSLLDKLAKAKSSAEHRLELLKAYSENSLIADTAVLILVEKEIAKFKKSSSFNIAEKKSLDPYDAIEEQMTTLLEDMPDETLINQILKKRKEERNLKEANAKDIELSHGINKEKE